ncbi:hypothetical protein [Lysinibacillus xylanilyticus]|uniref:hypothetical protein n=1 Tax=Lysinibacillus xylanilyticus TaxID=582475 RepID=UPI003D01C768
MCESEASATNVLTVRKRSVSDKCFNCAKAERQRQSAQSERKSTTRFGDDSKIFGKYVKMSIFFSTKKIYEHNYFASTVELDRILAREGETS